MPSAASTTGAAPRSRSRGSSTSSGASLTTTVGASRRSPSAAGLRVVQQLGERRSRRRRAGRPRRARPGCCRTCGRCRRRGSAAAAAPRCATTSSRNAWTSAADQPWSRARRTDAGREAVDRRAAARLDVGQQVQPAGPPSLERARARPRSGRPAAAPGRPAAAAAAPARPRRRRRRRRAAARPYDASAAEPGDAEHRRLLERPRHLVAASRSAGAAAATPAARPGTARRCRSASTSPAGSAASSASAIRRVSTAIGLARSGASALRALPAASRVPTSAGIRGRVEPGRASVQPALGRARAAHASNASVGTQTGSPSASARARAGRPRAATSTSSAATRLVDVQQRGGRLQVADAEPAAAQLAGRLGAPVVEQQLDPVDGFEGGPGRGPVDQAAGRGREVGDRRRRRRPARASCDRRAARAPTSPGRHDVPSPRGTSSRRASSSSAGVSASSGVRRAARLRRSPARRAASTCSSIARAAGLELGEQAGAEPLVGGPVSDMRPHPAGPGLRAPERVGHPGQRPQPAGRLPDQREVDEPLQRGRHGGRLGEHERGQFVPGGLTRDHEGIEHGELERAQPVERADDRGPGRRARRQLGGVVRGGSGEIGTVAQQPGQPLVRPARSWSASVRYPAPSAPLLRHPANATSGRAAGTPYAAARPGGGMKQVELHYGARTDVGRVRRSTRTPSSPRRRSSWSPTGWAGTTGGDVASRIVVEEFARLADDGYDPARGAELVAATLRREPAAHQRLRRAAARRRLDAAVRRHHRRRRAARRRRRRADVAARQPRRLPDLPAHGRPARAGQRRPLRRAGARRRRRDHRRGRRHPPRAARDHPRARRPGLRRGPTTSCCRCRPSSGCCSAPTASAG